MGSDSAYGEPNYAAPLGTNWTRATGPEIPALLEPPAEKLRRLLPEAKRLLSRQHIGEPWHALLAAEDLLREIDEARARFLAEVDRVCGMVAPVASADAPTSGTRAGVGP